MNLIGKILVGVIFVMSIVFMTLGVVLYSTQKDWKDKYNKVNEEKGLIASQNSKIQEESAKLKDEYQRLDDELKENQAKFNDEIAKLAEENNNLNTQVGLFSQENDNKTKVLESTQKNMADLRSELLDTRAKLATAQSDLHTQFAAMVAATDTARELALALATLKSTSDVLNRDLADSRYLLTQLGYGDLAPAVYDAHLRDVPPRVAGTITDVRPNGMLEINIGRDDGLLQGHKLHVYRDNQGVQSYLGRIEIIDVKPGKSVAKIMPEYRTGTILRNDNVTAYVSQVTASL
ncbi:MAG: hypothetical protein FWH27_07370 [Planctomycetaceae bacterium]|nr:hypothetical protein [Planctomycetaceae bacterium]